MEQYLKAIGILFGNVVMLIMGLTKIYKEGEEDEIIRSSNQSDQDLGNSCDGCDHRDDRVMGVIPKPLGDSDTGGGEKNPQRNDQRKRGTTARPNNRRRAKRRK